MKRIAKLLLLVSTAFILGSCVEVAPSASDLIDNNMDSDYEFTYGLREFIQYDPKNPMGIDILQHFDFFSTYSLKIYVVGGKISALELDNGNLPFDQYNFNLPQGKVDCYYYTEAVPHELKLKTGETIAYFQGGEFILPFKLDCEELSYKMTFYTTETTRENYEKAY